MTKWIIQNNLIKSVILTQFKEAFAELNIAFEEVKVIPFSANLPNFTPAEFNIFYGSTTLMLNAHANQIHKAGVFFDPSYFNVEFYLKKWSEKMLNSGGRILKFHEFIQDVVDNREEWFIRPNEDDKSFAGTIMTASEIKDWFIKIKGIDNPLLNADTIIFASERKHIIREWRNFVVNGKVIDSSRYMLNGQLNVDSRDTPSAMIDFVHDSCTEFTPHDIFVMDVAETEVGFKIIECNCFNGTGFYDHNIKKIVSAITSRIEEIKT